MRVTTCRACGAVFPAVRTRAYCDTCRAGAGVRQRNAHRTGANAVTRRPGMFIGVDGEGYTRPDGTHHYTMLSVGDATLTDPNGDHLKFPDIVAFLWEQYEANPDASFIGFFLGYDFTHWFATLPEKKAWRLLHKEGIASRKPATRANPVPWPVNYAGWEFDVLGSKRFKLRKEGAKNWMFVNDCGAYFQKSFLATIDPRQWADPVCTQREYDIIVEGKNARADVQTPEQWVASYDQTARYNRMENRILAIVMDRVKTGLGAEGIELDRDQWFGPGQAAQAWLQGIGQPLGDAIREVVPPWAIEAAQYSYYGGRFELMAHGHLMGPTYEFDINSAYPYAMTLMPDWIHSAYTRYTPDTLLRQHRDGTKRLSSVGGDTAEPGILPVLEWLQSCLGPSMDLGADLWFDTRRNDRRSCLPCETVCKPKTSSPHDARGKHPVDCAEGHRRYLRKGALSTGEHGATTERLGGLRTVPTHRFPGGILPALVDCTTIGDDPYMAALPCRRQDGTIAAPYRVRGWRWMHEVVAGVDAGLISAIQVHEMILIQSEQIDPLAEKMHQAYRRRLEVGKNTAHGIALKIVINSVYGKMAQSIGKPKFANSLAASFITSVCRSMLLDAIATHPGGTADVVMLATDGLYLRARHPGLDLTPGRLGAWEESVKHNLTLLKPGVYWDDKARDALLGGELPKLKSRGISARDLADNLTRIDEEFASDDFRNGFHWPTIRLTKNFNHISAKTAITRGNWALAGQIEWQDGVPHQKVTRTEAATPIAKRNAWDAPIIDARGDLRLRPWNTATGDGVSVPYDERFGRLAEEDPNQQFEQPDGDHGYMEELR